MKSEFTAVCLLFYYFLLDSSQEIRSILQSIISIYKSCHHVCMFSSLSLIYVSILYRSINRSTYLPTYGPTLVIYQNNIILVTQILFDFHSVFYHFYTPIYEKFKIFLFWKGKMLFFNLIDVPQLIYLFPYFGILHSYQFFGFVIEPWWISWYLFNSLYWVLTMCKTMFYALKI